MLGTEKGNVDTDIVFSIMKRLYQKDAFAKVVLVSGDGDYIMLVDFLIAEIGSKAGLKKKREP